VVLFFINPTRAGSCVVRCVVNENKNKLIPCIHAGFRAYFAFRCKPMPSYG
jgi:hypothetical protein